MMTDRLNPKQPEFVLVTSDYTKKFVMKHNIAHFYQFTAESNRMSVIPDACVDILFVKQDGKMTTRIAGTRLEKGETDTHINSEVFGVRFMPGTNPVNKLMKLSELVNNEEIFEEMISYEDREYLLESMFFAQSFEEKIHIFLTYYQKYFDWRLEEKTGLKGVLLDEIMKSNGNVKLTELSIFTGYSERYLNKKIHEEFGMNPKNLMRFIRFQKAVSQLTATINQFNGIDTALSSGYYDQSHFIKEFKKLSGLTPTSYIDNLLCNSYDKKLHVLS
ncbi:response regulator transcription factor [Anaeromicropila populeti]|uniref:Helix-turn-helix domain-containing protein n=1 Tax=Anaeromicropila populeti TaxID=37658 RepID=A0A1I6HNE2_9FIRM|nr:response regulator transcription factor [Anaeromicropila populeti]SFR55956.1 Helix-turn-helix domain-containing protein [Anaeromicropila populeti]